MFLFMYASMSSYASDDNDACEKTKAIVRETAIQQGVPSTIMSIESLRYKGDDLITHYSVTFTDEAAISRLIAALEKKGTRSKFHTQPKIVSKNRVLLEISTLGRPCIEVLCIVTNPLSASFYEQINAQTTNTSETVPPSPQQTKATIAETEKALERDEALPRQTDISTPPSADADKDSFTPTKETTIETSEVPSISTPKSPPLTEAESEHSHGDISQQIDVPPEPSAPHFPPANDDIKLEGANLTSALRSLKKRLEPEMVASQPDTTQTPEQEKSETEIAVKPVEKTEEKPDLEPPAIQTIPLTTVEQSQHTESVAEIIAEEQTQENQSTAGETIAEVVKEDSKTFSETTEQAKDETAPIVATSNETSQEMESQDTPHAVTENRTSSESDDFIPNISKDADVFISENKEDTEVIENYADSDVAPKPLQQVLSRIQEKMDGKEISETKVCITSERKIKDESVTTSYPLKDIPDQERIEEENIIVAENIEGEADTVISTIATENIEANESIPEVPDEYDITTDNESEVNTDVIEEVIVETEPQQEPLPISQEDTEDQEALAEGEDKSEEYGEGEVRTDISEEQPPVDDTSKTYPEMSQEPDSTISKEPENISDVIEEVIVETEPQQEPLPISQEDAQEQEALTEGKDRSEENIEGEVSVDVPEEKLPEDDTSKTYPEMSQEPDSTISKGPENISDVIEEVIVETEPQQKPLPISQEDTEEQKDIKEGEDRSEENIEGEVSVDVPEEVPLKDDTSEISPEISQNSDDAISEETENISDVTEEVIVETEPQEALAEGEDKSEKNIEGEASVDVPEKVPLEDDTSETSPEISQNSDDAISEEIENISDVTEEVIVETESQEAFAEGEDKSEENIKGEASIDAPEEELSEDDTNEIPHELSQDAYVAISEELEGEASVTEESTTETISQQILLPIPQEDIVDLENTEENESKTEQDTEIEVEKEQESETVVDDVTSVDSEPKQEVLPIPQEDIYESENIDEGKSDEDNSLEETVTVSLVEEPDKTDSSEIISAVTENADVEQEGETAVSDFTPTPSESQQELLPIPQEDIYESENIEEGEGNPEETLEEETTIAVSEEEAPETDREEVPPEADQEADTLVNDEQENVEAATEEEILETEQQESGPVIPIAPDNLESIQENEGEILAVNEGEGEQPKPVEDLRPGKIALILDDGGYGGDTTTRVLELDNRIALSILPDTPCAASTAKRAIEKGFEIMVHIPMQSGASSQIHTFPGELRLDMTKEEIQKRTREFLDQFPDATGANNHTGGAFTIDEERTEWFMEVVQKYGIFFVDSRTNWNSCAYGIAKEKKIPCDRRNIFLDNSDEPEEIRAYIKELAKRSRTQGTLIGIGHFRPNTITVLEEELPKLKDINIELVRVSEVVR